MGGNVLLLLTIYITYSHINLLDQVFYNLRKLVRSVHATTDVRIYVYFSPTTHDPTELQKS